MDKLPIELVQCILLLLPKNTLPIVFVCRQWRDIVKSTGIRLTKRSYCELITRKPQLRWAKSVGCNITREAMNAFAANGKLGLIKRSINLGCLGFNLRDIVEHAAKNNHINVLEWVKTVAGFTVDQVIVAAESCNIRTYSFLRDMGIDTHSNLDGIIKSAVIGGNRKLVKQLFRGCYTSAAVVNTACRCAIKHGQIDIFNYIAGRYDVNLDIMVSAAVRIHSVDGLRAILPYYNVCARQRLGFTTRVLLRSAGYEYLVEELHIICAWCSIRYLSPFLWLTIHVISVFAAHKAEVVSEGTVPCADRHA